jgi:hypothetical protein
MLKGLDPNQRWFTTESDFLALGFRPGLGPKSALNIGVHNGGGGQYSHMAGTLDGVPFESGSNGVRYGEGAAGADDPQFENHYHLPADAFNPPGDGSGSSESYTTKVTWTEKDDLNLQSAVVAVTQAKEDLAATQAKFAEGKKSQADVDQAELKVQKAEQKVRELENKRDNPEKDEKKGPAPQAADLTSNYTDDELDQRSLERAVTKANERRNEVYADPESTQSEKDDADDALQAARNAVNDPDRKKKSGSSSSGSGSTSVPDMFGDAAKAFVTGQLSDAFGVVGLESNLGPVGALINAGKTLSEQYKEKAPAAPARPYFSKEELAKQGPVTPGTEGWMEELLKTLTVPAVLRDMGGDLPHGMAALNLSGATEKVLTAGEKARYEQDMRDLAALRSNSPAGSAAGGPGFDALASEVRKLASRPTNHYTLNTRDVEENERRIRQINQLNALGAGSRF